MKRAANLSAFGMALALLVVQCVPAEAASIGKLQGTVRDQAGIPLTGVAVAIYNATAKKLDRPVHSATTDREGKFVAAIAPGRYVLRAAASGFSPFEARARVAANQVTNIDTIALRRTNTLAERVRNSPGDSYRRAARSSRGHVFHLDEEQVLEQHARALALTDEKNAPHGTVQTLATMGSTNYLATHFAITQRIAESQFTVVGQTGIGESAPQRVEATTALDITDDHNLEVTLGYGRLAARKAADSVVQSLDQYTIQAEDRWRVAAPLVVVFGVNFTRFGGASDQSTILPRLGVEFSPTTRTQVFASLTPGASLEEVSSFDLETGEVTFVEPALPNVDASNLAQATPDRSRRLQVGFGHLINERSNVEVMAFFDTISGHGVGLLSVPARGSDPEFRTTALEGSSRGMRVLYTYRLTDSLTGSVGYAYGTAPMLISNDLSNPAGLFRPASFQMLAGRLQADFDTGTRVQAVYRFAPGTVIFAIDPFAGRMMTYQPSTSILVAQSLRMPDFFPGEWEALIDIRNLFDVSPSNEDHDLTLSEYNRLIRAGLSFRF